jgi:transposase InsO family protein
MAVTQQQVQIYMKQRQQGVTQAAAAARAGVSERTGRRIDQGAVGVAKERHWRTRNDPFVEVWDELCKRLETDPELQALTLLEWLQDTYPGQYPDSLLRTLQRRVKAWRAAHGPDKEVMFPQRHEPGERGLSDFTTLKGVTVTIRGEAFEHRLFHFRLAYSGWSHVRVVHGGESYTALAEGVTEALEHLGGVPVEHRTDSLSAAFRNLDADAQRDITERYEVLCAHYGMRPSRNNPGRGHENGSVESPHGHLKRRMRQRLTLRGSTDFDDVAAYETFIAEVAASMNRRNAKRIATERAVLATLPCTRGVDYTEALVRVTTSSTFNFDKVLYSVPARLIGERLRVHAYDDRLILHHGGLKLLTLPRVRRTPGSTHRARCIDYRHVIGWLARKPRALAGLAFRDDLLPGPHWRALYTCLSARLSTEEVCKRVVAGLKLAAEEDCAEELGRFWLDALEAGGCPTLVDLQSRFCPRSAPPSPCHPGAGQHALADYDTLLTEPCHD